MTGAGGCGRAARRSRRAAAGGRTALLAVLVLVVPTAVVAARDTAWRGFGVPLARPLRHVIVLGPEAIRALSHAAEAWLLFDLALPDGDPSSLAFRFPGGGAWPGRALQPTMPTFGQSCRLQPISASSHPSVTIVSLFNNTTYLPRASFSP